MSYLDSISGKVGEKSLDCSANVRAYWSTFGNASGEYSQFIAKDLHASCRAVLGFSLGTTRNHRPERLSGTAERIMSYLAEGRLNMKIGKRFKIEEVAEAHCFVESRRSTGKVLLEMNS